MSDKERGGSPSFNKLKEIAANQAVTIKQQDEIRNNLDKQTAMKRQQLELDYAQFEAAKHADLRHDLKQAVDFAIRTLPFWNRSPKAIVNRATEILLAIRKETAKHVAMDVLASKIRDESVGKEIPTSSIVLEAKTVNIDEKGNAIIHATMDREGAEMEIK